MATPGSSQVQTSHATAAVGTEEDKAVDVVNVSEGEEEENSDDGGQPSKRKLTSVVWNDFEKVRVDGVWKAKCNHCNKKLSATSRNDDDDGRFNSFWSCLEDNEESER
ncbi:hypothetical protein E2562_024853 [Oryza meyeriana var. granulata]|uniref:BED-type domain-containing protein n=1 Tax=Oryza meyeriana var. granulata TaxID=110450 RepID=A0A6G1CI42_9ORYZ|nr:hypothetical protein E2562_024853 [Oryza meyeriana var. granulata]